MPYTISLTSRLSVELEQLARLARNLNCGEPPARPFTPDDSEWKDHMRTSVEGRAQFDRQWNTVCGLVQGDESYCLKTELTRGLYRWVRQDPGNAPGQILVTACEHTPSGSPTSSRSFSIRSEARSPVTGWLPPFATASSTHATPRPTVKSTT